MASKFLVWVNNGTTVMDYQAFSSLNDRIEGFRSGQKAIARNVNAGLRQANLVAAALMETILPASELDFRSSLDDVVNAMKAAHPFNIPMKLISTDCFGYAENSTTSGARKSLLIGLNNTVSKTGVGMFGQYNTAGNNYALICGQYNSPQTNSLFEVGAGSTSSRKNAFQVTNDGTTRVQTLRVISAPTEAQDAVRKLELDETNSNVSDLRADLFASAAPLDGYDRTKGTIEYRLTKLGFKSGTLSTSSSPSTNYIYKQGKYVYGKLVRSGASNTVSISSGGTLFTIPEGFRPKQAISCTIGLQMIIGSGSSAVNATLTLNTNGTATITYTASSSLIRAFDILFGYETN